MGKKNVLFVTYGGGHATMILPVVRTLMQLHGEQIACTTLALTMGGVLFRNQGIPHLGFADFMTDADDAARLHGERLLGNDHSPHTGITREESIAYLGLSYADMLARYGEVEAQRLYAEKGRMAFFPVNVLERVFDRVQPDLLVVTNSPRAEAAARHVATARGIPILVVTDLMGTFSHPINADHLTVASRVALDNYQSMPQVQAKHFHLLGNPAMDHLLAYRDLDIAAYKRMHFPEASWNRKIILLDQQQTYYLNDGNYGQWTTQERDASLHALYAIASQHNACLFVRPHPSLERGFFRQWILENHANDAFEAADYEIGPLLRCCDAVISGHSTMLLDAAYLHRPIIEARRAQGTHLLKFSELGFAYGAIWEDTDSMSTAVARALEDSGTNRQHREHFYTVFPELPCAPHITELIYGLITKQS